MPAYYRGPVRRGGNVSIFWPLSLFFFILSTICTGLWAYATMSEQKNSENAVKAEKEKVQMLTNTKDFYALVAAEERLILGQKLTEDEKDVWRTSRAEFFKDKGKFDVVDPKTRKIYTDLIVQAMNYQGFDEEAGRYGTDAARMDEKKDDRDDNNVFRAKLEEKDEQIRKLKAEVKDKDGKLADAARFRKDIVSKQEQANRDNLKMLKEGYETAQREAKMQNETTKEAFKRNSELVSELNEEKEKFDARELGWFAVLREKESKIRELENAKLVDPARAGVPAAPVDGGPKNRGLQALDISLGRALYDVPVGTVVSVSGNKLLIEVFADDKVDERLKLKTKLPFNVFAPPRNDGRADRQLKATIEIVSVQKGRFAEARVTGRFGDKNPIDEGDELFNAAWGTHVAVVGQCNLFGRGRGGDGQLEQARNLKSYLQRLEDQGAIIDAYVDLTDGSIKGQYGRITDKTRYLIVGGELNLAKGIAAALAGAPDAARADIELAAKKRIELINEQINLLKKEAKEQGRFFISPENFAALAGYRKVGGYGPDDVPFEPKLPVMPANPPAK